MSLYSPTNSINFSLSVPQSFTVQNAVPEAPLSDWREPSRRYAAVNELIRQGIIPDPQSRTEAYAALQQSNAFGVNLELEDSNKQFGRLYRYLDALLGDITKNPGNKDVLSELVGSLEAERQLQADAGSKRRMALSAIVATEFGEDKTFGKAPYVAKLMSLTGARNEEELINKYIEFGKASRNRAELFEKAKGEFLVSFGQSGDVDAALSSLSSPDVKEAARTLVKGNGRQAALQEAYAAIAPYAQRLKEKDDSEGDFNLTRRFDKKDGSMTEGGIYRDMAVSIAGLKDYDKIAAALELLPHVLPKDSNTWVFQSKEDLLSYLGRGADIAASLGDEDRRIIELANQIHNIRIDSRNVPDSWLGKGIRSTVYQVPRIGAVVGAGLLGSAVSSPAGGWYAATAMGSLVYGSESMSSSYVSGASKWSALGYGTSIGALEGAADMLAVGAGSLVGKAIARGAGKAVAESAWKGGVSSAVKSGVSGAMTEFAAETVTDPLGIAVENAYRMLGADLPVQNSFSQWAANYDPTDPEFIVPILLLGGGLGAMGGHATDTIHMQTLRSAPVNEALGVDASVAEMPDGPERERMMREGMERSELKPEKLAAAAPSLFNMTAENLNMLRGAIELPGFEPQQDGTIRITDKSGNSEVVTEELASTMLENLVETEHQEALMTVYNRAAQRHVAEVAREEGVTVNINKDGLDYMMALRKNKAESRALAAIYADPELSAQFASGERSLQDIMAGLETVALADQATIEVADGKADYLDLVEEMAHVRYEFDIRTGRVSERFINDNLRKFQQFANLELGDLTDYTQNREAVGRIARAAATNPSLLNNLPPSMASFVRWEQGHVAEVGRAIQEGEMLRDAARAGLIEGDFVSYLESVADVSKARESKMNAEFAEMVTGESPLPSVRRRRVPRVPEGRIESIEEMVASAMKNKPERTIRNIINALEGLSEARTDNQSLRRRAAFLRLLDKSIDLKRYGVSRKTVGDVITARSDERLGATVTAAVNETLAGMYQAEAEVAAKKARERASAIAKKQAEWEKKQAKKEREGYARTWERLLKQKGRQERRATKKEKERLAHDIRAIKGLARRQRKGRNTRSTTSDAEGRRQVLAAYEMMLLSPDEVLELRTPLEAEYEALAEKEQTEDVMREMDDIEYRVNMLDTFGAALYRDENDKGRLFYVRSADFINNALEKLKEIDRDGRARWKDTRDRQREVNREIIDEAVEKARAFHEMDRVSRQAQSDAERMKADSKRWKKWIDAFPSTVQYAKVLKDLGYEKLGGYLDKATSRSNAAEANGKNDRAARFTGILHDAAKLAGYSGSGIRSVARYHKNMMERTIDFAGAKHSKGQLIDIYMKSLNPHSRKVLIENNGYTAEQVDDAVNHIGDDGVRIAEGLFEFYREMGAAVKEAAEAYTGHPVFFDPFYTPIEVRNEKAGIADNMGLGGYNTTRVGKPRHLIDRVGHRNPIEIRDDPFTTAAAYGNVMSAWMGNIDLIELLNGVFTNRDFADSLRYDLGHNTYNAIKKNIVGDVDAGAIRASQTAMSEIVGKVMSARSFAFLGGNVMSAAKSALSYFKPVLMADISAIELTKGRALIKEGRNELSLQDIRNLEAIKARKVMSAEEKTIMDMISNGPATGIAQLDYLSNLSMQGLSTVDLFCIQHSTFLAAAALQARGLTGKALIDEVNSLVLRSSQPETSVTRSGLSKSASKAEAVFYQFLSEQMNSVGNMIANLKGGNKALAIQNLIAIAVTESVAAMMVQQLLGREDKDDLSAEAIAYTFLLAPITNIPIIGGVASVIASEAFGIPNYSYERSLYDFDGAYRKIKKTMEMVVDEKDYTSNEWVEHLGSTARTAGLFGMSIASTGGWERVNSMMKALSVSANSVLSAWRPLHKWTPNNEIDQLKLEAKDARFQVKEFESRFGKESPEAKIARRNLNRINRDLRQLRVGAE